VAENCYLTSAEIEMEISSLMAMVQYILC